RIVLIRRAEHESAPVQVQVRASRRAACRWNDAHLDLAPARGRDLARSGSRALRHRRKWARGGGVAAARGRTRELRHAFEKGFVERTHLDRDRLAAKELRVERVLAHRLDLSAQPSIVVGAAVQLFISFRHLLAKRWMERMHSSCGMPPVYR